MIAPSIIKEESVYYSGAKPRGSQQELTDEIVLQPAAVAWVHVGENGATMGVN